MLWKTTPATTARMHRLVARQTILSEIRNYFHERNFLEVETPLLVKKTAPDAFIDSVEAGEGYLITSTEYQIKRLIAEGFLKVFTLTKNFRAHDRGRYHSPEFTMLEWGRAFETLKIIEQDAEHFICKSFSKLYPDSEVVVFGGNEIRILDGPWEHLTVREAFEKHLGIKNLHNFSLENLVKASNEADIQLPIGFQNDKFAAISFLLDQLQSHLGKHKPVFLHEWPSYLTSSAPISEHDPYVAERTELYIGGIEIANGFPFLTEPEKQRSLFEEQNNKRKEIGKPLVSVDEKYIESLKSLPQGAGMALGIDRLAMVLAGASKLSDIQAFDWDDL